MLLATHLRLPEVRGKLCLPPWKLTYRTRKERLTDLDASFPGCDKCQGRNNTRKNGSHFSLPLSNGEPSGPGTGDPALQLSLLHNVVPSRLLATLSLLCWGRFTAYVSWESSPLAVTTLVIP